MIYSPPAGGDLSEVPPSKKDVKVRFSLLVDESCTTTVSHAAVNITKLLKKILANPKVTASDKLSVARGSAAQEAKEYMESASRDDRKRTAEDSGTLGGENAAKVHRCPICAIPAEANVVPHSCCIERMNKDFDAILTKPRNSMAEKRTNME